MQASRYYTFIDGKTAGGKITADRLNGNLNNLVTVLNGNIEADNIKTGAKVLCGDRSYIGSDKITGTFEFDIFPTVPNASVPDAKLSSNVPLKNAANVFSAQQKFGVGIDGNLAEAKNFVVEKVTTNPTWQSSDKGRVIFNTTDGKWYGGGNSAWKQLDYTGDYTGGAVRSYAHLLTLDDNDGVKVYFKTEGTPTVKVLLKGEAYPKRHYVELPYHTHSFTGTAHDHSVSDAGHYHTTDLGSHNHGTANYALSTHTHGLSGNTADPTANHTHTISEDTGSEASHTHGGITTGYDTTGAGSSHQHTVSATTSGQSAAHQHSISLTSGLPSAYQQITSVDLGDLSTDSKVTGATVNSNTAAGSNTYAGVNIGLALSSTQKLYGKSLTVKIDGTDVTSNILSATGWSAIGDGAGTHAFHTTGTGELDASAWKSYSPGLHTLEILEPESGYGCQVTLHVETN
jgi:hypothetical protein